jgi:hypothetical protein
LREGCQPGSYGKRILEANSRQVEDLGPTDDRPGSILDNINIGQVKQLAYSLSAGERHLVLGDFAKLTIAAFDGVGGINQASDTNKLEGLHNFVELVSLLLESIRIP